MSLVIYANQSEVSEGVRLEIDNDEYFDAKTKVPDSKLAKKIMKEIDGAEYNSGDTFVGRNKELGALNKMFLSTGTKTMLNVIAFPEVCFNLATCGNNVLDLLPEVSREINGVVLWKGCAYPFAENEECDFIFHGKHFSRVFDFVDEVFREDDTEFEEMDLF